MTEVKSRLRIGVQEVFIIMSLFCVKMSHQTGIQHIIKDMAVHEGYRIKYTFKDHYYLDVEIFPHPNLSDWFALALVKDVAGGNRVSLKHYNANDFEDSGSHVNVGNCNQIKTFTDHEKVFIIPTSCDLYSNGTYVIQIEDVTLKKLQFLPHSSVQDAHYWKSVYSDTLNLVLVTNQQSRPKLPSVLIHYILEKMDNKFMENDRIKQVNPVSLTAFVINDETYVAVSNYRDALGKFVDSVLYVQDNDSGRLEKYQDLRTKGAISFTYFCYVSDTKTEHFLLATNNKRIKVLGLSKSKNTEDRSIEESLMFKWDNDCFIPFQTLMVRLPSPWIMIPSGSDKLVLITWSYVDGITSYQYDGWRFKKTAQNQKDIINSPPLFVRLKTVSIAGETLFTIFSSEEGAKKKYFFVPLFKDSIKTRMDIDEKTTWCKIASQELRLGIRESSQHYLLLSRIQPNSSPQETISSLFNVMFGFNPSKNSYGSNLEIMSQHDITRSDWMRSQTSESSACEAATNVHELHRVRYTIALKQGILALKYPATIVFYPVSKSGGNNMTGIELYKLKEVSDIKVFKLVKLCKGQGVFIQGIQKGKLFARIYKMMIDGDYFDLSLFATLNIDKEPDSIIGTCNKNNVDIFITTPSSREGKCTMHIGTTSTHFRCDPKVKLLDNSIISVSPDNRIIRTMMRNDDLITETIKEVEKSSNIFIDTSDDNIFLLISNKNDSEICLIHDQDLNAIKSDCKETKIKKTDKNKIRFGLVRGDGAAFIGFHDRIEVLILSRKNVFTLKVNDEYDEFEPFSVSGVHFVALHSLISTTLIQYTNCLP